MKCTWNYLIFGILLIVVVGACGIFSPQPVASPSLPTPVDSPPVPAAASPAASSRSQDARGLDITRYQISCPTGTTQNPIPPSWLTFWIVRSNDKNRYASVDFEVQVLGTNDDPLFAYSANHLDVTSRRPYLTVAQDNNRSIPVIGGRGSKIKDIVMKVKNIEWHPISELNTESIPPLESLSPQILFFRGIPPFIQGEGLGGIYSLMMTVNNPTDFVIPTITINAVLKNSKGEVLDFFGGVAQNIGYGQPAQITLKSQSFSLCTGPLVPDNQYYLDLWTVYETKPMSNIVYQENLPLMAFIPTETPTPAPTIHPFTLTSQAEASSTMSAALTPSPTIGPSLSPDEQRTATIQALIDLITEQAKTPAP